MNKKIAIAALLTLSPLGMAMAAQNNVGCGAGSILFDGQTGVAPQVLAATTNGTLGNQTFGISSGTLGCTQDGVVSSTAKLSMFLDSNLDKVAYEMSVGSGETLESLASLMGVQEADKAAFFTALRENFAEIVPSAQAGTEEVMAGLNRVLSQDAALAQYATTV